MIALKSPLKLLSQIVIVLFILTTVAIFFASKVPVKKEVIIVYQTAEPEAILATLIPKGTQTTRAITLTPKLTPTLLSRVAVHNQITDCWMIIDNKIYNLTSYFGLHPGGNAALSKYCGKDGSIAFKSKDKNPVSEHSITAKKLLTEFEVR